MERSHKVLANKALVIFFTLAVKLLVLNPFALNPFVLNPVAATELLIEAKVDPVVSIVPGQKIAYIGNAGPSGITASLPFYITANTSRIHLQLLVTHLYKDANPALNIKLAVEESSGVSVMPLSARPVEGSSLDTRYSGSAELNKSEGVFRGLKTETITLEIPSGDVLQETINFGVGWLSNGATQPSGTYQGYVVVTVSAE